MAAQMRKIIEIDADKCNGCGICVDSCHEGAIQMVNGKARLIADSYCDGLGDCLAPCPTGAIRIVTREADAYDESAVKARLEATQRDKVAPARAAHAAPSSLPCGCPGQASRALKQKKAETGCCPSGHRDGEAPQVESELMNWPVQLRLVPPGAPYLKNADLLLAADCVPVAVPDFHARYLKNKPVIIACPKLEDNEPQIEKLADILRTAQPASLTVLRMEVPCCGGLVRVAEEAIRRAGLNTPMHVEIISVEGAAVQPV